MKKYIIHIKFFLLFVLIGFLFGFSALRNKDRLNKEIKLEFENGDNLFISYEMVNKLLIQKLGLDKYQSKENINLNDLEKFVQSNEMIENADIFLDINGEFGALIKQRTPILRVANNFETYYLDRLGKKMPLSNNYSARVPLCTNNFNANNSRDIVMLANYIKNDEFLRKQIIGINQKDSISQFELKTRIGNQLILFGMTNNMQEKFDKLKVFYQKVQSDSTMNKYKTIDLKFRNQVVCTKK